MGPGNLQGFSATNTPDDSNALPEGEYTATVVDSQMMPTKANDGHYLECVFKIAGGSYSGRRLYERFLYVSTAKSIEVSHRLLAQMCTAAGVPEPNDSQELHNIPIVIAVRQRVESYKGKTRIRNRIAAYKRIEPEDDKSVEPLHAAALPDSDSANCAAAEMSQTQEMAKKTLEARRRAKIRLLRARGKSKGEQHAA